MHVILWRFRARPGGDAAFEQAYDERGAWTNLFRADAGYLGTALMRGTDGTYLTIDRWTSEEAYRSFRESHAEPCATLDDACRALTVEESFLGAFEA